MRRAPGADVSHFDDLVHRIGLNDVTYAVGYDAWLDLTPPNVTKASALEHLRQQLGVYPDHTVAVWAVEQDRRVVTENVRDFAALAVGDPPVRVLFTSSRRFPRSRLNPGPLLTALQDWLNSGVAHPVESWLR